MSEPLTDQQINQHLEELPDWSVENDKLHKQFGFKNFKQAIGFLVRVAFEAEKAMHHPEIENVYNSVTLRLTTHDAGSKVTEKDVELAKKIDSLQS